MLVLHLYRPATPDRLAGDRHTISRRHGARGGFGGPFSCSRGRTPESGAAPTARGRREHDQRWGTRARTHASRVADAQDTMAIGVPIRGARLVVVRCGDERAATLVRRTISGSRRVQVACIRPAEMTALVAEYPRRADQIRRAGDAVRVATTACRTGGIITAGISSPLDNASQVAAAYQEATEAASLAVELSKPWAIADEHWAILGTRRLTMHLTSALTLANPLSRLRQYDNEQGTDLVTTIGTWLARNCDTASTAAALSVHPNTLRYRLRRAGEVSGLDLADAKVRALTLLLAGPSSV